MSTPRATPPASGADEPATTHIPHQQPGPQPMSPWHGGRPYPQPMQPPPGYGYPPPPHGAYAWPPPPPVPQPAARQRREWPWIVGGIVALLFVIVIASPSPSPSATSTSTGSATSPAQPIPASDSPAFGGAVPAPASAGPAKGITAREWALIAKDPKAHVGEAVVVYGQVTQFDAVTGEQVFRANVDGVQHPPGDFYPTNTVLAGNQQQLASIVQDDLFRAEVVVTGSVTYNNTLGGSMTAPTMAVQKIDVIGSANT